MYNNKKTCPHFPDTFHLIGFISQDPGTGTTRKSKGILKRQTGMAYLEQCCLEEVYLVGLQYQEARLFLRGLAGTLHKLNTNVFHQTRY